MSALEQTELFKSRPESKFLQTGDFKTHYVEMGSGGTPIILIHGGGAGADGWSNWHSCLPLFAKHRRTIAIDLVGGGWVRGCVGAWVRGVAVNRVPSFSCRSENS